MITSDSIRINWNSFTLEKHGESWRKILNEYRAISTLNHFSNKLVNLFTKVNRNSFAFATSKDYAVPEVAKNLISAGLWSNKEPQLENPGFVERKIPKDHSSSNFSSKLLQKHVFHPSLVGLHKLRHVVRFSGFTSAVALGATNKQSWNRKLKIMKMTSDEVASFASGKRLENTFPFQVEAKWNNNYS